MPSVRSNIEMTLLASIVAMAALGCVETKKIPIDLASCKPEPRLMGVWTSDQPTRATPQAGDAVVVEPYSPSGRDDLPKGIMQLHLRSKGGERSNSRYFFVTRIAGEDYAVMLYRGDDRVVEEGKWDQSKLKGCWLWRYRLAGEKIDVWEADKQAAEAEIDAGILAGEVTTGGGKYVEIDMAPSKLIDYLAKGGGAKRLFPDKNRQQFKKRE